MEQMDWNTTSRKPMALRSKRGAELVVLNFFSFLSLIASVY